MIPKIIHYCWISGEENMPADIKACIESWKKHLPDYTFINWNDTNFDWNICEFTKWHRQDNQYAFCADYVRFWALYNYGGIYLDSDVFVCKSLDPILQLQRIITREGIEDRLEAAILGCEKGDEAFKKVIEWYNNCTEHYSKDSNYVAPCVMRDAWEDYEVVDVDDIKEVIPIPNRISILSRDKYFDPTSKECFAVHCFKGSWWNPKENCLQNII